MTWYLHIDLTVDEQLGQAFLSTFPYEIGDYLLCTDFSTGIALISLSHEALTEMQLASLKNAPLMALAGYQVLTRQEVESVLAEAGKSHEEIERVLLSEGNTGKDRRNDVDSSRQE